MAQAEKEVREFVGVERAWLKQSVMTQRNVLMRSRQKEIVGSEIWSLRGKEIEALNNLLSRLEKE